MIDVPILVKDALREGSYKKNYRFIVLNDDGTTDFTIDNDNLIKESVTIDERMNSGDTLKFGLCEGSSLELQYFGKANINGRRIQAILDVQYGEGVNDWHSIPMGFFTVEKCSRQASTGIIKITAYNKLMSDYLDSKANDAIVDIVAGGEEGQTNVSYYYILKSLLSDYSIEEYSIKSIEPDITQRQLDDAYAFQEWIDYHFAGAQEIVFPLRGGSLYLHIQTFALTTQVEYFGVPTWYVQDVFNAQVAQNIVASVYNLGNALDNYAVVSYDTAETMSLREFLTNEGYLTFRANTVGSTPSAETQKALVGGRLSNYYDSVYLTSLTEDYTTPIGHGGHLLLPYRAFVDTFSNTSASATDYTTYFKPLHNTFEWIYKSYEMDVPAIAKNTIDETEAKALADVTLRELQSAVYETACQYGQLDRQTDLFSGVELNHSRLLPQDTLYPDSSLYPVGGALSATRSMYSKLWADEGNIHKWKYLIITYKGLDTQGNEVEKTLQRTVNADGTDNYNMSDNWLFKNLVWAEEDVGAYADAMVLKMQDVSWFPFEMWCAGLPYLETGDEIEIPLGEDTYVSYILQRTLKGIQNLQDTYINGTLDIF